MNPPDGTGRRTNSNPSDATTTGRPTNLVTTRATDDVSNISNVSESSSTTTAASATRAILDDLNFDSGVASDFTLDILDGTGRRTNSNPSDATTTGRPTNLVTTRATDDVSDVSIVSESSSTTTAASATRAVLDNLNFDSGVAGDFTLDILQHSDKKESVCDNLHNRYEDRRSLRNPNPTLTKQGDLPEEPSLK
jgi:hypothetical protein